MTRLLASDFHPARILATEVDRVQLEKNLALPPIPGVEFRYGGAEAIEAPDASLDAVFMFKSLHHVPRHLLAQSLVEIHRVLVPGGRAYFSEPVYWGGFNEVMRLIHDERDVRDAAFQALVQAVAAGLFELEAEVFFKTPATYENWEIFEDRFLKVTHTQLAIGPRDYDCIRAAFLAHRNAVKYGMKIGTDGVQLLGGHGFTRSHPVEMYYRNLRALAMLDGMLLA